MTGTEPTGIEATGVQGADPPGPQRWRSAPAAALLNLTGLGLGYLYLGYRWRAVVAAGVTVVLVVVAFATDAASTPLLWQALAPVVLVGMGVDGWRLAHADRRRSGAVPVPDRAARGRPVAIALAAVVAVVAAYLGYGAAGRSVHADARAAQARGDCPAAVRGFDLVTGPFELTLSRDVLTAAALRAECTSFLDAQQAQEQRRYADAVAGYRGFRAAHPRSVLVPFASDHLQRTYAAWASALRQDRQFDRAVGVYRDLLAEVGDGPVAVPARADLAATYLERSSATRARVAATSEPPAVDLVTSAVADLLVVAREFADTPARARFPRPWRRPTPLPPGRCASSATATRCRCCGTSPASRPTPVISSGRRTRTAPLHCWSAASASSARDVRLTPSSRSPSSPRPTRTTRAPRRPAPR